ncbi:MAG TPA: putative Ig domain-containing protein [Acidimicrobiales bacterium]
MIARATKSFTDHKKRFIPLAVAVALLLGLFVSLAVTPNAQADYTVGCGYGYSSTGTFGYGSGNAFGYGYGTGGTFHFGYGDQVCPMFVTTATLPGGTIGTAYSSQLSATGGTNSYTWAITSGALPGGLSLSSGGLISGTPNANGTYGFNATATDGNGQSATRTLAITISSTTTTGGGGGGTTTTTSVTTTTLAGTTTTTVAGATTTTTATKPPKRPSGCELRGAIRSRKTIDVIITGHNFYAQPRLRFNDPGTRGIVRHDNGSRLIAVVQVRGFGHVGRLFTLTITDADGFSCRIGYRLH